MTYDVAVIGAGHNGLTSACYLAKAGLKVILLEKRPKVGGLCNTEEFFPSYFAPVGADVYGMLRPQIVADLGLYEHGLQVETFDPQIFMPFPNGKYIALWRSLEKTISEIRKFSHKDAEAFLQYSKFTQDAADVVDSFLLQPPPTWEVLKNAFHEKGIPDAYDLMLTGTISDLLDQHFESPEIKAALMLGAVFFRSAGPKQVGTAMAHFLTSNHVTLNEKNTAGYVIGGMGQVTAVLESVARRLGVEILTDTPVERILTSRNHVKGIQIKGKVIEVKNIISCVDIKQTFLNLLKSTDLPDDFRKHVQDLHASGNHTRIVTALDKLPVFSCVKDTDPTIGYTGYIAIAPSVDYADVAWHQSNEGRASFKPIIGISIPSVVDSGLAPQGHHVMSIYVLFTPYQTPIDEIVTSYRDCVTNRAFDLIEDYAPGFKDSVISYKTYTPMDLEQQYGATYGGCDHISMSIQQMFSSRPLPDWNNYTTPIGGLFLGGASTHPGGSVSGAPGYNSAHKLIELL